MTPSSLPAERIAQLARLGITIHKPNAGEVSQVERTRTKRDAPALTKHVCTCGRPAVIKNNSGGWDCELCYKARSPHRVKRHMRKARVVKQMSA